MPFVIILLNIFNPTSLSSDRPGVPFLSIPISAQAWAMGSTGTTLVEDPSVIQFNPGAIGFFDNFNITVINQGPPPGIGRVAEDVWLKALATLVYDETKNLIPEPSWLGWLHPDMRYIYGGCIIPFKRSINFGASYTYFATGKTDVIDENGQYLGSYTPYDYAIALSAGRCLKHLGIGITAKYIYSLLVPDWVPFWNGVNGNSWAIDFGIQYRYRGLTFGLAMQNLGPRINYSSWSSERLPTRFRWGICIEPVIILDSILIEEEMTFKVNDFLNVRYCIERSYDAKYPEEDIWNGRGMEIRILKYFSYRFGRFEWMGKSSGFGIVFGIYKIDMAKYYGDAYHVQLTINPGATRYLADNETKRKIFTLGSIFIVPGAAQFYKGEGIKGTVFFIPAILCANTYFTTDYEDKKLLSLLAIGGLYVSSAIEALR